VVRPDEQRYDVMPGALLKSPSSSTGSGVARARTSARRPAGLDALQRLDLEVRVGEREVRVADVGVDAADRA
jgi:hypothetical protein